MALFMLTTLLAPVTIWNKLLFLVLIIWTIFLFLGVKTSRPKVVWSAFGVIGIFMYGYAISMAFPGNDRALAMQFLLASFLPILIHFVEFYKINLDKHAQMCGRVLVAWTLIFYGALQYSDFPYAEQIISWFRDANQAATSERDFLGDSPLQTFALSTVAFLFVPWCLTIIRIRDQFRWVDLLWLILLALCMLVSGRRGTVGVALLFVAYVFLTTGPSFSRLIFSAILFIGLIFYFPLVLSETDIFSGGEVSNAVKIGHFDSYFNQLNWARSVFGSGLGSFYFSSGSNEWKQHTELTPLDLARYVGIPLAASFYFILLWPRLFRRPFSGQRHLILCAFSLYLLLSVTNPVLINSYGMLVVVWFWSKYRGIAHEA